MSLSAIVLLVPATAWATHTFADVPDDRFYSDAVEWAFENGITTGTSDTTSGQVCHATWLFGPGS